MAAIKGARASAHARRGRFLRRFPWLAAGLGSLAVRDAQGQSSVDTRFLFYKESGGRTQVLNPVVFLNQDFGDTYGKLGLLVGYDAISGASPTGAYPTSETTTSASGHLINAGSFPQSPYTDARKSASLSYERRFGAQIPSIDISYAKENDYVARSFGLSDSWTMAQGRGTLHFGVSFARDLVEPVKNPTSNPEGKNLQFDKSENGFSLGYSWILGERDLIDVSGSLMQLSGYLNDPYKVVPIGATGETTLPENRPDTRSRRALVVKYGHHYPWEGAIRIIYRYYNDSWSVQAHTLEVTYDHHLSGDWMVSPQIRFYTQSGASFYGSKFVVPQTDMSADYRLSPFDNLLGGLTLTHRIDGALSVNVGATYQHQWGRDRVTPIPKPGSPLAGPISAADMNVLTFTIGLTKLF